MSPARFLRPSRRGACMPLWLCVLALTACGELAGGAGRSGIEATGAGTPPGPATAALEPALSPGLFPTPAVFEATGTARWDGRRTLQGVWVAHPQVSAARRVRIYNAATGAAADGALFTRDAVLSGPTMLVSSDAARLLGLVPGEETELRVVAVAPRAPTGAEVAVPAAAAAGRTSAATPAAAPSAAPAGASPAAPSAATVSAAAARPAAAATAPARAAARPAAADTATAAAARPAVPDVAPASAAAPSPESAPAAGDTSRAVASAGDAAPGAPAGALAQPYVQAGLFAVSGNAERLIRRIEAEGLPAIGKPVRLATGPATRVLAGPFATAAARDAARRRIRAMGLSDAIPVAR